MVFLTGDTHGTIDYSKLNADNFSKRYHVCEGDSLIILGDFGGVWTGGKKDNWLLDWYAEKPWTTYFVDGNHENFTALYNYDTAVRDQAKCHVIRDNVLHVMRGEILYLERTKFFCFGGASSHDKEWRTPERSWWEQENPNALEYANGWKNLEHFGFDVDYILTHCASSSIVRMLSCDYEIDEQNRWFNILEKSVKFKRWYFGHYHIDRAIDASHVAMYDRIERVV